MIGSLPFQFRLGFRFVFFREMKKKLLLILRMKSYVAQCLTIQLVAKGNSRKNISWYFLLQACLPANAKACNQ